MSEVLTELAREPREAAIPLPGEIPATGLSENAGREACRKRADELLKAGDAFAAWACLHQAAMSADADASLLRDAVEAAHRVHRSDVIDDYLVRLEKLGAFEPQERIIAARVACLNADFSRAEELLQEAFDRADSASWHLAYGFYHERLGQWGWAATAYKLALRYTPDSLEAQTGLISVLIEQDAYKQAQERLESIAPLLEGKAAGDYLRGRLALAVNKDWRTAEDALLEAVRREPWHFEAWMWLGHVRAAVERLTTAEYAYRHAWYLSPRSPHALTCLGRINLALEKADRAIALLEQVLELAPLSKVAGGLLAQAYAIGGREADAQSLRSRLGLAETPQQETSAVKEDQPSPEAPQVAAVEKPVAVGASGREEPLALNQYQNLGSGATPMSVEERDYHLALSDELLPGPMYRQYLSTIHQWMRPKSYVEIGVESGATLTFAQPTTRCIGIDPDPRICVDFPAPTEIYKLPSDDFFARHDIQALLGGPIEFAFIDGLHVFEQVLRDFINVEKHSSSRTVIVFHDCYPINEITQRPNRETFFWTGDPWKIVPCLKECRPDLEVMTIKTKPSGLAMVLGCDPTNTVLTDNYKEIEQRFTNMPYSAIEVNKDEALNAVANDWGYVRSRIMAHRK